MVGQLTKIIQMKSDMTKTANPKSFGVIATSSNGQAD